MLSLPISLTDLQIDEVLRYMGTPPDRAEPAIRKLAEECAQELLGVARPRWAARTFELTLEEVGVRLSSGLLLPGEDLKRHLAGCRRAVLFCATLSAQADALIRRAESGDMLRALALDCCATAAVEQLIDHDTLGIYHIVCQGRCSRYDFAQAILKAAHMEDKLELHPIRAADAGSTPSYTVLDNLMLRLDNLPQPRPWKEALNEYINSLQ